MVTTHLIKMQNTHHTINIGHGWLIELLLALGLLPAWGTGPQLPAPGPKDTCAEAEEFPKDHHGKPILRFDDVTPTLLENLDHGKFE